MEIVLKSLASAVVTGIILLLAKFSGPKLAGAIGGIPIVFAISYVLITMENKAARCQRFSCGRHIRRNCSNFL